MLSLYRKYKKVKRMERFYGKLIPQNGLSFDIGANQGRYTVLFLRKSSKVIAVEPQQSCFDELVKQFNADDRVVIIQSAIGSAISKGILHIGLNNEVSTLSQDFISAYSVYKYNSWPDQEEVPITTLDQLIAEYGIPDFCKLDIEGWEPEAFKGLSKELPLVSFEYNFLLKPKAIECVKLLADKGNYLFNFSAYEECRFHSEQWMNEKVFSAFIGKMPPAILHGDIYAKSYK